MLGEAADDHIFNDVYVYDSHSDVVDREGRWVAEQSHLIHSSGSWEAADVVRWLG